MFKFVHLALDGVIALSIFLEKDLAAALAVGLVRYLDDHLQVALHDFGIVLSHVRFLCPFFVDQSEKFCFFILQLIDIALPFVL